MAKDGFRAVADVWVVPRPKGSKYHKSEWTKRLFSCIVRVDPHESDAEGSNVLNVHLEDRKTHELIANAPYDGQRGITSVTDSARHYVITLQSRTLEAFVGIEFRDPADSIDFSLAIQSFMRHQMFADRHGWPSWSKRKTANMESRRPRSKSTTEALEAAKAEDTSSDDDTASDTTSVGSPKQESPESSSDNAETTPWQSPSESSAGPTPLGSPTIRSPASDGLSGSSPNRHESPSQPLSPDQLDRSESPEPSSSEPSSKASSQASIASMCAHFKPIAPTNLGTRSAPLVLSPPMFSDATGADPEAITPPEYLTTSSLWRKPLVGSLDEEFGEFQTA